MYIHMQLNTRLCPLAKSHHLLLQKRQLQRRLHLKNDLSKRFFIGLKNFVNFLSDNTTVANYSNLAEKFGSFALLDGKEAFYTLQSFMSRVPFSKSEICDLSYAICMRKLFPTLCRRAAEFGFSSAATPISSGVAHFETGYYAGHYGSRAILFVPT